MTTFNSAKETEKLFDQTARALYLTGDSYTIVKNALRQAFVMGINWQIDQEIKELDKKIDDLYFDQMCANC